MNSTSPDLIVKLLAGIAGLLAIIYNLYNLRSLRSRMKNSLKEDLELFERLNKTDFNVEGIKRQIAIGINRIYNGNGKRSNRAEIANAIVMISVALLFLIYEYYSNRFSWVFFISLVFVYGGISLLIEELFKKQEE